MQVTLNDGRRIPQLGLGLWQTPAGAAAEIVAAALQAGYRHLDTAAVYGNEAGVGQGLAASGVAREDVFVTTKVWNDAQGYDATLRAAQRQPEAAATSAHVDLYLVHWPAPRRGLYVETWRALIALREQGLAKSIGVSNFGAGASGAHRRRNRRHARPQPDRVAPAFSATRLARVPRRERHSDEVLGAARPRADVRRSRRARASPPSTAARRRKS